MSAGLLVDIYLGIAFLIAGWALPQFATHAYRSVQLRLTGRVFPTIAAGRETPVLHLRASFDEIMFGSNPATLRGYTHSGDVQAVVKIIDYFDDLPIQVKFDYFPEIKDEMKNVVIVGVSSRSEVSRELNSELVDRGFRIRCSSKHAWYQTPDGQQLSCEHAEVGDRTIVVRDAGVVYRRQADNGAIILLCAGIHTFGSQAAAEVAMSREFQRFVRKTGAQQFIQFVTVDVIKAGPRAGLGLVTQSIRWRNLPFVNLVTP